MAFFNINSVINLKYYDYIKAGTNVPSQMIYDTDVYWNGNSSIPGYSRDTKNPLNNLILIKAHSGNLDSGLSDDYVQGNAYNLFFKAFTNDRMFIPSTVNTYLVEAYKETIHGREVVNYRLPMGGGMAHLQGTPLSGQNPLDIPTTDPDFYDHIPVMGVIPFNVRGFLKSTDHNNRTVSYGEKDILIRRLTHRDISDWSETFQSYIDDNIEKWKDLGIVVYNPEGHNYETIESNEGTFNNINVNSISLTDERQSGIKINSTIQVNGNIEGDEITVANGEFNFIDTGILFGNDVSIKKLHVTKSSNLDGSTYIEDLYISQGHGNYVSLSELIDDQTISNSLTVDLGEGEAIGDAIDGLSYEAGTKLEDILRDILIKRYCNWTYVAPQATITASFGPDYSSAVDTPTISGTSIIAEYRNSPLQVVIRKTYTKNDGPTNHTSIGFPSGSDASSRGFAPGASGTWSVSWVIGTKANGGNLKVDSKGTYNGIKGVTYNTNTRKIGYSTKLASEYSAREAVYDATGTELSTCNAGSVSKTFTYNAYYPSFVHIGTENSAYTARSFAVSDGLIRNTSRFLNKKNSNSYSINVAANQKLISIVVPRTKTLKKVIYVENSNADITATFTNGDTAPFDVSVGYVDYTSVAIPNVSFRVYQYWGVWRSAATLQVTLQ